MPTLIVPDRFLRPLWAIERNDKRGFITWEDHANKIGPAGQPTASLLLWTTVQLCERYCAEEIRGSGHPHPIHKNEVVEFLEQIHRDTKVKYVMLNKPPADAVDGASFRTGIAEIPVLVQYLKSGGRLGGDGAA